MSVLRNKKTIIPLTLIGLSGVAWFLFFGNQKNSELTISEQRQQTIPAAKILEPGEDKTGSQMKLAHGLVAEVYADAIKKPYSFAFDPYNRLLVASPSEKVIYLIENNTIPASEAVGNKYEKQINSNQENKPLAQKLLKIESGPSGLVFVCDNQIPIKSCELYIVSETQLLRARYDATSGTIGVPEQLARLPQSSLNPRRSLQLGLDKKLYIGIGSSCNVCVEKDDRSAAIYSYSLIEKTGLKRLATGVRNPAFLALNPLTGSLWATEQSRTGLGADIPKDEINLITEKSDYGWPYCFNNKEYDVFFDPKKTKQCGYTKEPIILLPNNSGVHGLGFIPPLSVWPKEWQNNLIVAVRGSAESNELPRYSLVRYVLNSNQDTAVAPGDGEWVTGLTTDAANASIEPAMLLFGPGGDLFFADEAGGRIIRIRYSGEK